MSSTFLPDAAKRSWADEVRACALLSWPLVVTNAIEMAMNLTNTAMIGRLNPEALAASALATALDGLCLVFGIGVTAAVSPLISGALGRGEETGQAARRVVQQGLWAVAAITGPMWVLLWHAESVLKALGQQPALAAQATLYLHALQWSILPALVYMVLRSLLASLGRARVAVITGGVAVLLNALLNWLLIGGHAGFPALGLFGSGLATLLSNIFMASALAAVILLSPRLRGLGVFSGLFRPPWRGWGTFWRLGLPIGIGLLFENSMFGAAAGLVGRFDAASLAAHAIALQATSLTFMVPLGIAQAATIRVGHASGAGNDLGVFRAGWAALCLGLTTMVVSATVFLSAPHAIVGLFIDRGEPGAATVEAVAVTLLGLAGLFQIADGAQVVLAGMLRGLHDTRAPMIIAAVGYWGIGLPCGALLAFGLDLRAPGVWMGLTAGLFAAALLLLLRWRRLLRAAVRRSYDGGSVQAA